MIKQGFTISAGGWSQTGHGWRPPNRQTRGEASRGCFNAEDDKESDDGANQAPRNEINLLELVFSVAVIHCCCRCRCRCCHQSLLNGVHQDGDQVGGALDDEDVEELVEVDAATLGVAVDAVVEEERAVVEQIGVEARRFRCTLR